MKTLLTDVELTDVALVDKGANGGALITLYKRHEEPIVDTTALRLQTMIVKTRLALAKGGAGSGNFGHAGRPGERGGRVSSW